MPVTITLPEFSAPSEYPILQVEPARWDADSLGSLARQHGLDAGFEDRGLWHIAQTERQVLEVYAASQSFRLSRRGAASELDLASDSGLDEQEAIARAYDYLTPYLPAGVESFASVFESELLISEREGEEPKRLVIGTQVSLALSLDGVSLIGPGAKLQVTLDANGEVDSAYRMWRESTRIDVVPGRSADELAARFGDSPMFSDLSDETARVEVTSVSAGLLSVPPTERQPLLYPAVQLSGTVSTETASEVGFQTVIAAVDPRHLPDRRTVRVAAMPAVMIA
ncbi:hypothetical protein NOCA240027 [metagenome]|uniref:Uncharacterized protein n=1 Tax=metagenome TaxID=256318 RepID=A0A2P2C5I2_9ZZZZ